MRALVFNCGSSGALGNAAAALVAGYAKYVCVFRALAQGQFVRFGQAPAARAISGPPANALRLTDKPLSDFAVILLDLATLVGIFVSARLAQTKERSGKLAPFKGVVGETPPAPPPPN